MDALAVALISRTDSIVARRVRGTSVKWTKKARWALFDKRLFDRLLDDIAEHLARLLPQMAETQQELCRFEVEAVQAGQPGPVVELLHDASRANKDALLEKATQAAIDASGAGHCWQRTEADNQSEVYQGDRVAQGSHKQSPV
jgi:hypothetical protein